MLLTLVIAVAVLAYMLMLSSSLSPLVLLFGRNWQPVAAVLGTIGLAVICVMANRYTAPHGS